MNDGALFVRLVAVAERLVTLEAAFEYELTQEPASLFSNGLMRKAKKSVLMKELLKDTTTVSPRGSLFDSICF